MLFNSFEYLLVFLPLCFLSYFVLAKVTGAISAKAFLYLASLFFYSWWNPVYLPLLLGSTVFNFYLGRTMLKKPEIARKPVLATGIVINLLPLFVYKYLDFSIEIVNSLSGGGFELINLALPLAISFFTFQQIAYLVDCYKNQAEEKSFLDYGLFVSFFPQLISGPIVHHKEMMPQFQNIGSQKTVPKHIAMGLFLIAMGLAKKVFLADNFSSWADVGFIHSENIDFAQAWISSLSFTFQLYFDFSAYTDMALGSALLFNIYLPLNFNSPYKALSIRDFWRRWHMTLSRWLKDYVYIRLGGNRHGRSRLLVALLLTFLVGGIWHGAGWNFVIWGLLHGIAVVVCYGFQSKGWSLPTLIAWPLTFLFVHIAWVFFRAPELSIAINMLQAMFDVSSFQGLDPKLILPLLACLLALLFVLLLPNSNELAGLPGQKDVKTRIQPSFLSACRTAFLLMFALYFLKTAEAFLYFQF